MSPSDTGLSAIGLVARFCAQYIPPGEDEVSESSVSEPDICSPLSSSARSKSDELVDALYGSFLLDFRDL